VGAKEEVMASKSITTLLAGVVDYAGLFPPAALPMSDAVQDYAEHLRSPHAWMLARFILPLSRIAEFESSTQNILPVDSSPWRLSVLGSASPQKDAEALLKFNGRNLGAIIDAVEIKVSRVEEILAASSVFPKSIRVFVEIPIEKDPTALIQAIADVGLQAKVRTGGITSEAFPTSDALARFIATCVQARIQFKATAGLHHPIRSTYNLTYKPESERAPMYGFLNVFLASAFAAKGVSSSDVKEILQEESIAEFRFDDDGMTWRSHRLTLNDLKNARENVTLSFGSCSFRDPVDDLNALQLL
jgi:hypothetical protein